MRLLTAPGVAGIAVVLVEAHERASAQIVIGETASCARTSCGMPPCRASLRLDGQRIDDVLVVPRANGQLELHLHGSAAVLCALDQHFGLVAAPPENAAHRLLRSALGEAQLMLALEQATPGFTASLVAARSIPAAARRVAILDAIRRSRIALAMATPFRVALVGQQNAGKSTLFNCLLQCERTLTGATPGLTRDPVREFTLLDGYPYELIDTAGDGAVTEPIDLAAIRAARMAREHSFSMLIVDVANGQAATDLPQLQGAAIVLGCKSDLVAAAGSINWGRRPDALVSAHRDEPGAIRAVVGRLLRDARALPEAGPVGGFAALDDGELESLQAAVETDR